jgi:hypothetical protein
MMVQSTINICLFLKKTWVKSIGLEINGLGWKLENWQKTD